jgi:hypothetical protein
VAEAQLFLTLLLSVMLRTSEDALVMDTLGEDAYGTILVVAFFPAPSVELVLLSTKMHTFFKGRGKSGNTTVPQNSVSAEQPLGEDSRSSATARRLPTSVASDSSSCSRGGSGESASRVQAEQGRNKS